MKKRGKGIGMSFYGTGYGNGFPDVSTCIVRLLDDEKVGLFVGGSEVGQGTKTVFKQLAAETIGISINDIVLEMEDTNITPDSGTAAASRQTYNTGNAIKIACENFIHEVKEVSKRELKLNSSVGLKVSNNKVYIENFPQKSITFKELAVLKGEEAIEAKGQFTAQTVQMDDDTGQGAPYWPYTFNACGVELEVDILTGKVDILKAVMAQDVGRAINPNMVEGQMDGGFAMALGYVLFEDLKINEGKIENNKFSRYLIPTAMDVIDLEKIIVEDPESTAPYGAKGIGEPVMIHVGPAVLNAIYDAIGVRITELPATPERIIAAMDSVKEEEK